MLLFKFTYKGRLSTHKIHKYKKKEKKKKRWFIYEWTPLTTLQWPLTSVGVRSEMGSSAANLNVSLCRWKEEVQRPKKDTEMDRSVMTGALWEFIPAHTDEIHYRIHIRNTHNHSLALTNTLPTSLTYWYMQQTSQCSQLRCLCLCFCGCLSLSLGMGLMSVRWGRLVWSLMINKKVEDKHSLRDNSSKYYTACNADYLFMLTGIKLLSLTPLKIILRCGNIPIPPAVNKMTC